MTKRRADLASKYASNCFQRVRTAQNDTLIVKREPYKMACNGRRIIPKKGSFSTLPIQTCSFIKRSFWR